MRRDHESQAAAFDLGQHQRTQRKVVLVDLSPGGESDVGRLRVCALHQPDRRLERHQARDVADGPMQVRLQRQADVGVLRAEGLVEVDGALGVGAALHVDPQKALRIGGRARKPPQVRVGGFRVDVETQLGGLDRHLGLDPGGRGEDFLVVLHHAVGVGQVDDVLAQKGEERSDPPGLEFDRRLQRRLETLSRKEAPDRPAGEPPARNVRGEPRILRAPQQQPSHQARTTVKQA